MLRPCLFILSAIAVLVSFPAFAGPYYIQRHPNVAFSPESDARGCYWYRQREFCSRYCYWEVNGKRYCHHHEREAYPQGLVYDPYLLGPGLK